MLKITSLLFNFRENLPFADSIPTISWSAESDRGADRQVEFRLTCKKRGGGTVYDSGPVASAEQSCVPLFTPEPYTEYVCRAEIRDTCGETASAEKAFETGKLGDPWQAEWICAGKELDDDAVAPVYVFAKRVRLKGRPARARLYVSALGCYGIALNGQQVGDGYFAPGYTQYTDRVQYQAYDVTGLVSEDTEIRAELAGGWYTGRLGISLKGNRYGKQRALLAELRVLYGDGSREVFGTDAGWRLTEDGPRRKASFFDGEEYDARREDESAWEWRAAARYPGAVPALECDGGVPVRRRETLSPTDIRKTEKGYVVTFAKNFAGVIELEGIRAAAGQTVTVTHGEILKDGEVYTENLRTAEARLTYVCRDGVQSYSPRFTYMGFRHVCVSGADIGPENIRAHVLSSDNGAAGEFSCSDSRLNRLQENIVTSQTANFMDIPTDCPQRDERCGWTGDIAVFAETACFNMNVNAFMAKWLKDVRLNQTHRGIVPMFVPDGMYGRLKNDGVYGFIHKADDAVWGDSIVLVPYAVYRSTGDITVLRDNYEAMKKWARYEEEQCAKFSVGSKRYIWSWGFHFGDWLAPGESILKNMSKGKWTSTAYFAHTCDLLSQIASLLGKTDDAALYASLFGKVKDAFRKVFLNGKGEIKNGFQSIYALAIAFGLLSEEEKAVNGELLNADVLANGCRLTTGFAGTPQLLPALCMTGHADTAMKVLTQEGCPGWLYPIKCGATSMWERWDSLREDGTVNTDSVGGGSMVSFNHYAYGAVGNWMYEQIGGLQIVEAGYRSFRVAPLTGLGITGCKCSHLSPYGEIRTEWETSGDGFACTVTVPFGCRCTVRTPGGKEHTLAPGTHTVRE